MKARKVFRLDGGHRYIRQALKQRGWVEKITPRTKRFEIGQRADTNDDQTDPDDLNHDLGTRLFRKPDYFK